MSTYFSDGVIDGYDGLLRGGSPVGHRHLQQQDPVFTIAFFLFGAMILYFGCSLSHGYKRDEADAARQREEDVRIAQETAVKEAARRRKELSNAFVDNKLQQTLAAEDIHKRETSDENGGESPTSTLGGSCGQPITDVEAKLEAKTIKQDNDDSAESDQGVEAPATSATQLHLETSSSPEAAIGNMTKREVKPQFEDADGFLLGEVVLKRDGQDFAIPITCAICLEQYETGDSVVWSGNSLCTHGFHHTCILDYLVYNDSEAAPCPCCRQIFLPMK